MFECRVIELMREIADLYQKSHPPAANEIKDLNVRSICEICQTQVTASFDGRKEFTVHQANGLCPEGRSDFRVIVK